MTICYRLFCITDMVCGSFRLDEFSWIFLERCLKDFFFVKIPAKIGKKIDFFYTLHLLVLLSPLQADYLHLILSFSKKYHPGHFCCNLTRPTHLGGMGSFGSRGYYLGLAHIVSAPPPVGVALSPHLEEVCGKPCGVGNSKI